MPTAPYRPGLEGVVAAQTAISSVDAEKGKLAIRGFSVEDLAPHVTFEDMVFLLWHDVLPNNAQATPMSYVSPATQRQYVLISVPATEAPEVSHVAEPEAQRGASKGARPTQPAASERGGGWIIAYALPR